jgi:hypothetical protein
MIEDEDVIKKILKHLGLWDQKARPPPKANSPEYHIDYTNSQLPMSDNYLYVDPVYPETFTALFLKEQMGPRDSCTQFSSIFPSAGMIKPLIHCHGIHTFPNPNLHVWSDNCLHNILRSDFA